MKKFLTLALTAAMSAALLAGCGSNTTQTANTDTDADTAQTDSDWAYIESKGEMIIGITLFEPMNYFDENGELTGFETEFATAVCDKLGIKPNFQEIDWGSKEIELNSKNIDCIWNGMTVTEEREENMSLSTHYMQNRQVFVVKAENADEYSQSVDGLTVIAESGSTGEELISSDEFFAAAEYTAVDSQAKAFMDVAAGTSDAAVVDYVMAAGSLGEGTDYEDLVIIDKDFDQQEDYAVAFRKDSDVTEQVNAAIEELAADGTLSEIADKYNLSDLLLAD